MQFSATIAVLLGLAHLIDGALIPAVKLRALHGPDSSAPEGSPTGYNWGNWGSSSGHEVMITKTDYNTVVVSCETSTTSPVADITTHIKSTATLPIATSTLTSTIPNVTSESSIVESEISSAVVPSSSSVEVLSTSANSPVDITSLIPTLSIPGYVHPAPGSSAIESTSSNDAITAVASSYISSLSDETSTITYDSTATITSCSTIYITVSAAPVSSTAADSSEEDGAMGCFGSTVFVTVSATTTIATMSTGPVFSYTFPPFPSSILTAAPSAITSIVTPPYSNSTLSTSDNSGMTGTISGSSSPTATASPTFTGAAMQFRSNHAILGAVMAAYWLAM